MSNFTTAKQVVAALEQALIKDAAAYIRELNSGGVVSRSHLTLRHLYLNFGKDKTDLEVSRQFAMACEHVYADDGDPRCINCNAPASPGTRQQCPPVQLTPVPFVFNQEWQCTECDWHGHEDDLDSTCTFLGNREEPAEYDGHCPECGGNWDQMEEYDPGAEIDAVELMMTDR